MDLNIEHFKKKLFIDINWQEDEGTEYFEIGQNSIINGLFESHEI